MDQDHRMSENASCLFKISVLRKQDTKHTDLLTGKFPSAASSGWGSALRLLAVVAHLPGPLDPLTAPPLFLGVSLKAAEKIRELAANMHKTWPKQYGHNKVLSHTKTPQTKASRYQSTPL